MLAHASKQQRPASAAAASLHSSGVSAWGTATAQLKAVAHLGEHSPVAVALEAFPDAAIRRFAIKLITAQRAAEKARADSDKAQTEAFDEMDARFRAQAEFRLDAKAVLTRMTNVLNRVKEVHMKTDQQTSDFLVEMLTAHRTMMQLREKETKAATNSLKQSISTRENDVARLEHEQRKTAQYGLHKAGRLAIGWNAAETRHRSEDAMMTGLLRLSLEEAEERWSTDVSNCQLELASTVRRMPRLGSRAQGQLTLTFAVCL